MKHIKNNNKVSLTLLAIINCFMLGCATPSVITNHNVIAEENFRSSQMTNKIDNELSVSQLIERINQPSKNQLPTRSQTFPHKQNLFQQTLSPGDKVNVFIPEGEEFSGIFTIEMDGSIRLPHLNPITAIGSTPFTLAEKVKSHLINQGIFRDDFISVSIQAVQWAPVHIAISGDVYNPGKILINQRNHKEDFNPVTSLTGDNANKRLLSSALKAAGGVKPTANIQEVQLIRNGKTTVLDMSGLLNGLPVIDPPLSAGDQLIVPSAGYLQTALLRPSTITPPGFRVYLSNLTIPADSNNKSSNNKFASSLPPGSRLLTGAMSANCVGGTISVNAERKILLAGKDPITQQIRVLERSLKELIAQPNLDSVNPYLMPQDNIACYDSGMTNARDIARSVSDFLRPFVILSGGAL